MVLPGQGVDDRVCRGGAAVAKQTIPCPCGGNGSFADCCGRYVDTGEIAPSAEALMRSRYTAYVLLREDYLLATWHPSTRPVALALEEDSATKWTDLEVKRHERLDAEHAIVEFVARYKVNGRAYRLHEVSRFVREEERWFYVDGIRDG
jgi:SEC-C motif-containing protein